MAKWVGKLWVTGTTLLICFIAYSSQIFIIWPWYGAELSVELLYLLLPFNTLVALLLWNYYLCATTDPGRVPKGWEPDTNSEAQEVKKYTKAPRYCRNCQQYKPPRSHHCRQCRRCVLRMDHHCPWVNNCVGHFNYGYFIRFLFFVDVACLYHLAMVTLRMNDSFVNGYWAQPGNLEIVFIIMNYVACVPVIVMVGLFSLYHYWCLLCNTTTIEGWEKNKVATMIRRGRIEEIKFPYVQPPFDWNLYELANALQDLGMRRNITAVLGSNPLMWCWPRKAGGDGLSYPFGEGTVLHQAQWPPADPYDNEEEEEDASNSINERLDGQSPWTYGNGLNPSLVARRPSSKRSVPPYHPDYQGNPDQDAEWTSEEDGEEDNAEVIHPPPRIRRGSEGYEIRELNREEVLQRYMDSRGSDATELHRRIPVT